MSCETLSHPGNGTGFHAHVHVQATSDEGAGKFAASRDGGDSRTSDSWEVVVVGVGSSTSSSVGCRSCVAATCCTLRVAVGAAGREWWATSRLRTSGCGRGLGESGHTMTLGAHGEGSGASGPSRGAHVPSSTSSYVKPVW